MDQIEFRRGCRRGWWAGESDRLYELAHVIVNGERLDELCSRMVPDRPFASLRTDEVFAGLPLWSPEQTDEPYLTLGDVDLRLPDGRVAIVTCACGGFECWGLVARIAVEGSSVEWSDIDYKPDDLNPRPPRPDLGPFRFDLDGYRSSLYAFDPATRAPGPDPCKRLVVKYEFTAFPVMIDGEDEYEEVVVPTELRDDLRAWAEEMDHAKWRDPEPPSAPLTGGEWAEWRRRGRELADRLQAEVGHEFVVGYANDVDGESETSDSV